MPELPEVEAARHLLETNIVGKRIVDVRAEPDAKLFKQLVESPTHPTDPADLSARLTQALQHTEVVSVERRGKQLWLQLSGKKGDASQRASTKADGALALAIHFGMTGFMAVRGEKRVAYVNTSTGTDEWPPRFTKLELTLRDASSSSSKNAGKETAVAYADARRFGNVKLLDGKELAALIAPLGPDALSLPASFPSDFVRRGGRRPVKTALMDQALLAGVGNWVADEVLLAARVHPEARAADLSAAQAAAITAAIRDVCTTACAVDADADRYPPDWLFHVRWTPKPGAKVSGCPVSWTTIGGRTTAFVPALQKKTDVKTEVKAEVKPPPPPPARGKRRAPSPPAPRRGGKATRASARALKK